MTIKIPKIKKLTLKEFQKKYPWIQSIENDTSPEKAVTLELTTVLKAGEDYISSKEYERRRQDIPVLGYSQAQWLSRSPRRIPRTQETAREDIHRLPRYDGSVR